MGGGVQFKQVTPPCICCVAVGVKVLVGVGVTVFVAVLVAVLVLVGVAVNTGEAMAFKSLNIAAEFLSVVNKYCKSSTRNGSFLPSERIPPTNPKF